MKLLQFKAAWCSPCKHLSKILADVTYPFPVEYLDLDEDFEKAQQYAVRSVPTIILLDNEGNEVERHVGIISPSELEEKFFYY